MKAEAKRMIAVNLGAAALLVAGSYAYSSPIGNLGGDSSATIELSLVLGEVVRVSFPDGDVELVYNGVDDIEISHEFCIYSNQASVDLEIEVEVGNKPTGGTANPVLMSGSQQLQYSLAMQLADGTPIASASDIRQQGVILASHSDANTTSDLCSVGGVSHRFLIEVAAADIDLAPGGEYTDTIQVNVGLN